MKKTTYILAIATLAITSTNLLAYSGGSGTSSNPYIIANKADLIEFSVDQPNYGKHFKMTADIDFEGETFWGIAQDSNKTPGFQGNEFTGTFDGNGHVISNFKISGRRDYNSLFGRIGNTYSFGTVKNLGVVNCIISNCVNYAGGLCGDLASGTIDNCYATGIIEIDQSKYNAGYGRYIGGLCGNSGSKSTIINSYSSCIVQGSYEAGGICGNNEGTIRNCYSTSSVTYSSWVGGFAAINGEENGDYYLGGFCGSNRGDINNCYSTGNVNGDCYIGGFCGSNSATISNCYSTGSVTGYKYLGGFCGKNDSSAIINNCYSVGKINGTSSIIGGFCETNSGTISASFWDILTSGMMGSSGGTGMMTMQLQNEITFTSVGWNFVDTWVIDGYPVLKDLEASVMYKNWAEDCGIPGNKQEYYDCPTGDGIKNLMKYAIGLDPMKVCSSADIMQPLSETNRFGIVYHKSKDAKYVNLYPMWSNSLITNNWFSNGFKFTMMSETSSNETWKATFQIPISSGYIKLKAKED